MIKTSGKNYENKQRSEKFIHLNCDKISLVGWWWILDMLLWAVEELENKLKKRKTLTKIRNVEWVISSPIDWGYVGDHTGSYSDDKKTDAHLCQSVIHSRRKKLHETDA